MSATPGTDRQALLENAFLELRKMRKRLADEEQSRREPIAIIGIGCRFPGANNPADFWTMLLNGVDAIREVPAERWALDPNDMGSPEANARRWGSFLDQVHDFDPYFFQLSPREAAAMDPQQRLFLEVAWEALEDAGQVPARLAGSPVGVFAGVYNSDFSWAPYSDASRIDSYTGTGTVHSFIPGRSSFLFDFRGPSIAVDTVCSSSLVAVHLACQALRSGDCNLALAGGVNLILSPESSVMVSKLQALAPDGRCKTFDASANGFVRGEGCGIVALKRLSAAVADGDNIWAVIRGSAVNHDGRSVWMTSPNPLAQQEVISKALANGGVSAADIGYVETHGTGTPLGDPIELEALGEVLGSAGSDRRCVLGALKTNIGHLEAAAGVAGLIKAALALHHGRIPGNLHFRELNPRIRLDGTRFVIPIAGEPWSRSERARYAGVSSFGLSGTNAHVILQEAPAMERPAVGPDISRLLPLSAATPEALDALVASWPQFLTNESTLDALCHTAAVRRTHHTHRLAVVADSPLQLRSRLEAAAEGRVVPGVVRGSKDNERLPQVAFVFPGQGGQWVGMGRQLSRNEAEFRRAIEECGEAIGKEVEWSLVDELGRDEGLIREGRIDVIQPVIFALQVALARLWRFWGIECQAVAGQSLGEVAAACVAGALTIDEAARIICRRSRLLRRISGKGSMALVELSFEEASRALSGYEDRLSIAVSNSARSTVLSGDPQALESVLEILRAKDVFCRLVKVDVASHSPQVDPLCNDLLRLLNGVTSRTGTHPMYSTVTGTVCSGEEFKAGYWVRNLRDPVLFAGTLRQLVADGYNTFIEISPHPVVMPAIQEGLRALGATGLVLESTRRDEDERAVMLGSLGALYTSGADVNWERVCPRNSHVPVRLPSYPWRRQHLQREFPGAQPAPKLAGRRGSHPLLYGHIESSATPGTHYWEVSIDTWPALRDHRVEGAVVVPTVAYLEMAYAAVLEITGSKPWSIEDVEIPQGLFIGEHDAPQTQFVIERESADSFSFAVRSRSAGSEWTEHARGRVRIGAAVDGPQVTLPSAEIEKGRPVSSDDHYTAMKRMGLDYGPGFQGVKRLWRKDSEAWAEIGFEQSPEDFQIAPALLDSGLQALASALPGEGLFLPVAIQSVQFVGRVSEAVRSHAQYAQSPTGQFEGEVSFLDSTGRLLVALNGVRLKSLSRSQTSDGPSEYRVEWKRQDPPAGPAATPARWIFVGKPLAVDREITDRLSLSGHECAFSDRFDGESLETIRGPLNVVYAGALDDTSDATGVEACIDVTGIVRALSGRSGDEPARLWLLTSGIHGAALSGLAATIVHEHPEFRTTHIEVSSLDDVPVRRALAEELLSEGGEDRLRLGPDGRHVARLVQRTTAPLVEVPLIPAGSRQFRASIGVPGNLGSVRLRETFPQPPGVGEVQIDVAAAGLNFLDVLTALNALPGLAGGPVLGRECAGQISAIGPGVSGFEVGQRVIAIAADTFATTATVPADHVVTVPATLSLEEVACIPIAFATAHYSLLNVARLQRGERVLIHAATGGVGLAAVQIAQSLGAEIFATAGNPEKRDYLRSLGVRHIYDSRSLEFAAQIRHETCGEGVDVVLNSLSGEFISRSLELLREGGRFIELGKIDYLKGHHLAMRPFLNGISFHFVDLLRIQQKRPEVIQSLLREVLERMERREYVPIRHTVRPIGDLESAIREMAQGAHTGKIVFTFAGKRETPIQPVAAGSITSEGSYLITGGLGGIGLKLAARLVAKGARSLVLIGRGEPDEGTRERLTELENTGASINVVRADVSNLGDLRAAFSRADNSDAPVRGIFHCAAVLDDGLLADLTPEQFRSAFAAKARGAWNLNLLTTERALDFFVLFSSAASILGSAGQANYAAANSFVDALARYRREQGLVATSIQWGAWGEIGLAAAEANRGDRLASRGIPSFTPQQGLDALERVMVGTDTEVAVMSFDFDQWSRFYTRASQSTFFAELSRGQAAPSKATMPALLRAAEVGDRRRMLEDRLREHIVQVLRIDRARIERRAPFRSLGLDSLMALEFRNRLEADLDLRLPATLAWSFPNVAVLTTELAKRIQIPLEEPPAPAAMAANANSESLDQLTRAQLAAALAAELGAEEVHP